MTKSKVGNKRDYLIDRAYSKIVLREILNRQQHALNFIWRSYFTNEIYVNKA